MNDIQMVDLRGQYHAMQSQIDTAIQEVLEAGSFIRGPFVDRFERELASYLGGRFAIGVGNGTDALQIAMMALGMGPGDEVITPAFTFIATAEAAALLGITPIFADIDPRTFNIDPTRIEELITPKTRAIIPVHLFGQTADMDPILEVAGRHQLAVIEDNAQAIGSTYKDRKAGYIGQMGTLSFFPSKNLGAYGDAGAVLTNEETLAERVRMIANHGSRKKYYNEVVGINSRLDALQAAILRVKLQHLDHFAEARIRAADRYDALFSDTDRVIPPFRDPNSKHVFHQYTIRVGVDRDGLAQHLKEKGIPSAIYYPVPLHQLPVFSGRVDVRDGNLHETERACNEVLSLPMHTELTPDEQEFIAQSVLEYVNG